MKKILMIFYISLIVFACDKPKKSQASEQDNARQELTWHDIYYKKAEAAKGWKFIIIHHSATSFGSAKAFHKYHKKMGYGGLAYHFVIGNGRGAGNGEVQVGFRWKYQIAGTHATVNAWYHNVFGIGICLVGNFQKYRPTGKQIKAVIKLVRKLSRMYNISYKNVMGHGDIPHGELLYENGEISFSPNGKRERRVCPGRYFPMKYVKRIAFKR